MLSVKQGSCEYQFKVIGLTRLGIKPKFTAPEADALNTRKSELEPLAWHSLFLNLFWRDKTVKQNWIEMICVFLLRLPSFTSD